MQGELTNSPEHQKLVSIYSGGTEKNSNHFEDVMYQLIFYNIYINTINQELIYRDIKYLVYNHRKEVCFYPKQSMCHWYMLTSKETKTRDCAGLFTLLLSSIFSRLKYPSFSLPPRLVQVFDHHRFRFISLNSASSSSSSKKLILNS